MGNDNPNSVRPSGLVLVGGWNGMCAVWLAYVIFMDLLSLFRERDQGPVGIFFTWKLVVLVYAIPTQLATVWAFMESGLKMGIAIEIFAACAFFITAIGLWRLRCSARRLAIGIFSIQIVLLALYLSYVGPSFEAELRQASKFFVWLGPAFLALEISMLAYIVRPAIGKHFIN